EARAAAPRGGELDPDGPFGRTGHQFGHAIFGGRRQLDRRRPGPGLDLATHHNIPSSSRASSLILAGSHGGAHTTLTWASRTPGTELTRSSTSPGIDSAAGQRGGVSVTVTMTAPPGLMSTP